LNEKQIIQGCKNGERKAQRAFVDLYSSYMYTICKRYTKDDFAAQDCLQNALVQVLTNIKKYTDQGTFKPWISRVTVTKCLEYLRKNKKHISSEILPTMEPSEDGKVLYKLELEEVMLFLNTLPDNYKIALNMYLVEGYSHKEIGKYMGLTESTSRSLVTRGRKMIQARFEEETLSVVHKKKNVERIPNGSISTTKTK